MTSLGTTSGEKGRLGRLWGAITTFGSKLRARRRPIIAAFTSVVLFFGTAVGLNWWLDRDDDTSWASTITVLVTCILVAVTYQYVRLTSEMVRTQLTAEGRAGTYAILASLLDRAQELAAAASSVSKYFPISVGDRLPPKSEIRARSDDLLKWSRSLIDWAPRVPEDMMQEVTVTALLGAKAAGVAFLVGDSLQASTLGYDPRSSEAWASLRKTYESRQLIPHDLFRNLPENFQQLTSDVATPPEWDELLAGVWITVPKDAAYGLMKAITDKLRSFGSS